MQVKSNPWFDEPLADPRRQMADLLVPWEGDCWRFQSISHPQGHEILNGQGALAHGGSWNVAYFPRNKSTASTVVLHDEAGIRTMLAGRKR